MNKDRGKSEEGVSSNERTLFNFLFFLVGNRKSLTLMM